MPETEASFCVREDYDEILFGRANATGAALAEFCQNFDVFRLPIFRNEAEMLVKEAEPGHRRRVEYLTVKGK